MFQRVNKHNETMLPRALTTFSILAGKFPVLFIWNLRLDNQGTQLGHDEVLSIILKFCFT